MVSRWQFIILTNSQTLYSIIIEGKGISNKDSFLVQAQKGIYDQLVFDGNGSLYETYLAPFANSVEFYRPSNRRILGSMKELIFQVKVDLLEFGLSLPLVNTRINETPMSMLDHRNPKIAMLALRERFQRE